MKSTCGKNTKSHSNCYAGRKNFCDRGEMVLFSRRRKDPAKGSARAVSSHRMPQKPWYASLVTILIFSLVGWLFAVNVQSNYDYTPSTNTEELLTQRERKVTDLTQEVKSLTNQIDVLKKNISSASRVNPDQANTGTGDSGNANASSNSSQPNLTAVKGTGITVVLDDSPLWEQHAQSSNDDGTNNVNDYVIHQQDIEAVVNALWAGGAEAMTIQGQRVTVSTAVRCVGNVLLLEGKQYAPPYKISAIGDYSRMTTALNSSEAIKIYKEYVKADGLGYSVKKESELYFPAATATTQTLKYASVSR